ncbi:zinc ABC transporter permease [Bifidobacterium aemilianum]|uniref:Zinc ABC transporter permease n=1 Tax=Bifidobacterium aemilianum TaxID=2493120 RepID=A0A366K985_9BIFI|nr:DUF3159 domain-containing protein [Bifidobacterium aemilianum]RBP98300.1 zinc ABC transporter permease [Bifidobacterium aemilianum]
MAEEERNTEAGQGLAGPGAGPDRPADKAGSKARAKGTGLAALAQVGDGDDFSVIAAIGGPRGVIESMLPGLVFVVAFIISSDLRLTIIISGLLALLQVVVRLCQRQSVLGALSGLIAVGICLVWAAKSHEARNYYMFGFITNVVYASLLGLSLLVRVPGLGAVIEFIRSLPMDHFREWLNSWRSDRELRRAYDVITLLWIGLFGGRLLIQVPLYLTNHVTALGSARLAMGIPLWALTIWVSYLIVAGPMHRHKLAERQAEAEGADDLPNPQAPAEDAGRSELTDSQTGASRGADPTLATGAADPA